MSINSHKRYRYSLVIMAIAGVMLLTITGIDRFWFVFELLLYGFAGLLALLIPILLVIAAAFRLSSRGYRRIWWDFLPWPLSLFATTLYQAIKCADSGGHMSDSGVISMTICDESLYRALDYYGHSYVSILFILIIVFFIGLPLYMRYSNNHNLSKTGAINRLSKFSIGIFTIITLYILLDITTCGITGRSIFDFQFCNLSAIPMWNWSIWIIVGLIGYWQIICSIMPKGFFRNKKQ